MLQDPLLIIYRKFKFNATPRPTLMCSEDPLRFHLKPTWNNYFEKSLFHMCIQNNTYMLENI